MEQIKRFLRQKGICLSLEIDNGTIEQIPKFFFSFYDCKRYVQLTLNLANLEKLRASDLDEFVNLDTLDITANNLREIGENSLNELQKLTNFRLEANKLTLIPEKLFFNQLFLDTLKLVLRKIVLLPKKLVKYNVFLRSLKIQCLSNTALDYFYTGGKLEVLQIVLLNQSILPTQAAEKIIQTNNNIQEFTISQFHLDEYKSVNNWKFTRLTVFDSSINMQCLKNFFKNPLLKYANISNNDGLNCVSMCTENKHDSLAYLNLKENNITVIENKAFQKFVKLQILDLSCNLIEEILLTNMFNDLRSLKVLNLQNNEILTLDEYCFEPLIDLEVLNLTRNHIKVNVIDICKRLKSLKRLSLAANDLQTLENPENPKDLTGYALEVLDVQFNKIKSIDETFLDSMVNLRYLYLNNNQIASLNRYCFLCLPCLEYLNLSHNLLESLDGVLFLTLRYLKTLKLNNNKISCLSDDLFKKAQYLELLDLSSNKITEIPPKIFELNRCIRHLDLSYNSITVIAEDAFSYSDFECVNLTNNIDLKNSSELTMAMISCDNCLFIVNKQIINNNKILKVQLRNPKNYVIQKVVEISKV